MAMNRTYNTYGGIHLDEVSSFKFLKKQLKEISYEEERNEINFLDWTHFQEEFPVTYKSMIKSGNYYISKIDEWGIMTLSDGNDKKNITFHPSTFLYHPFTLN